MLNEVFNAPIICGFFDPYNLQKLLWPFFFLIYGDIAVILHSLVQHLVQCYLYFMLIVTLVKFCTKVNLSDNSLLI